MTNRVRCRSARNLSTVLRVLGDYLDRKAAGDFVVLCAPYSVTVRYGLKSESFTMQDLYEYVPEKDPTVAL